VAADAAGQYMNVHNSYWNNLDLVWAPARTYLPLVRAIAAVAVDASPNVDFQSAQDVYELQWTFNGLAVGKMMHLPFRTEYLTGKW
jgi:hypothetical protein